MPQPNQRNDGTPSPTRPAGPSIACRLAVLMAIVMFAGCSTHSRHSAGLWPEPEHDAPVTPRTLVLHAADYQSLYTLAGGLKPMSSGFWRCSFDADDPEPGELHEVQGMLGVLRNDVWYADIQIFAKIYDGERSAQAFVVHRESLARLIDRHESFWSEWDITPDTDPRELVHIVDRMPREDRWRGYGYLYGYPDEAVDFFVEAGIAADDGGEMGPGKDREFMQIPTYAAESGHFTYAIPLDHVPTPADRALAEDAGRILEEYERQRPQMRDAEDAVRVLRELNDQFERPANSEPAEPAESVESGPSAPLRTNAVGNR